MHLLFLLIQAASSQSISSMYSSGIHLTDASNASCTSMQVDKNQTEYWEALKYFMEIDSWWLCHLICASLVNSLAPLFFLFMTGEKTKHHQGLCAYRNPCSLSWKVAHLCVLNSHAFSKQIHSDCECTLAHCHNLQMPKNRYPWWMSCASCATLCSWSEGAVEHTARHIHQSKERRNGRERNEEIRPKPKKKRKVMCRN